MSLRQGLFFAHWKKTPKHPPTTDKGFGAKQAAFFTFYAEKRLLEAEFAGFGRINLV